MITEIEFKNIDEYVTYLRQVYGNEFIAINEDLLKVIFAASRNLIYGEKEYSIAIERNSALIGEKE